MFLSPFFLVVYCFYSFSSYCLALVNITEEDIRNYNQSDRIVVGGNVIVAGGDVLVSSYCSLSSTTSSLQWEVLYNKIKRPITPHDSEELEVLNPFDNLISFPVIFIVDGGAQLNILDYQTAKNLNLTLIYQCWIRFGGSSKKYFGNLTVAEIYSPSQKFTGTAPTSFCVLPHPNLPFKNVLSTSFLNDAGLCHCPSKGFTDCSCPT